MKIEEPGPVRKPLPLTPLVDVVFLLLLFFMLTSTFTKFGQTNLTAGDVADDDASSNGRSAASMPGVILRVSRGPTIQVNGQRVELRELVTILNDHGFNGALSASVQPSANATVQDLVTVLETARLSHLKFITVDR